KIGISSGFWRISRKLASVACSGSSPRKWTISASGFSDVMKMSSTGKTNRSAPAATTTSTAREEGRRWRAEGQGARGEGQRWEEWKSGRGGEWGVGAPAAPGLPADGSAGASPSHNTLLALPSWPFPLRRLLFILRILSAGGTGRWRTRR